MISRVIGGVLLIVGTSIGGGMLALPIATAQAGFFSSCFFMIAAWLLMTAGALCLLEANLYLPRGKHMISMAYATLGSPGLLVAWLSYLFLLYTLLAAYISGGSDILAFLLETSGMHLEPTTASFLFTLFFGLIVYGGIYSVDYANRVLMFAKLGVYLLLVVLIAPKVNITHYLSGHPRYISSAVMILLTSFGFAIIVPNLRDYFNEDVKTLKRVIYVGSAIPLLCYIAWNAIIMGTIPSEGDTGLVAMVNNPRATSAMAQTLSHIIQNPLISQLFNFFTSVCMLTAFLGVSLCLFSFLADGLKLRDHGAHGLGLFLLTFFPPLVLVIYYPGAYLHALGFAGMLCVILLLLLPALMCYFGRSRFSSSYRVPGGRAVLVLIIAISMALLIYEIYKIHTG